MMLENISFSGSGQAFNVAKSIGDEIRPLAQDMFLSPSHAVHTKYGCNLVSPLDSYQNTLSLCIKKVWKILPLIPLSLIRYNSELLTGTLDILHILGFAFRANNIIIFLKLSIKRNIYLNLPCSNNRKMKKPTSIVSVRNSGSA